MKTLNYNSKMMVTRQKSKLARYVNNYCHQNHGELHKVHQVHNNQEFEDKGLFLRKEKNITPTRGMYAKPTLKTRNG